MDDEFYSWVGVWLAACFAAAIGARVYLDLDWEQFLYLLLALPMLSLACVLFVINRARPDSDISFLTFIFFYIGACSLMLAVFFD